MPEEWFEIARINYDKMVLHGRAAIGVDEYGVRREMMIEQTLTADQKEQVEALLSKSDRQMQRLLASFVDRTTPTDGGPA